MERTYWVKQESDKPAFPDLLWSRPESKQAKGKLLIIGGNSFGFSAVGTGYREALSAGAGTVRVLLPEAIRKVVGTILEHAEYGASNPSGSFSQQALGAWLEHSGWSDGVLIAGDLGRNSETAILFEKFLVKSSAPITIAKDAVDYVMPLSKALINRPSTTLVLSLAQLQKLATSLSFTQAFRLGMSLVQLVEILHEFSVKYGYEIVVKHQDSICIAVNGKVSTTKLKEDKEFWRVETAAHCVVWRIQNPTKPFEALTSALLF
jgi:ADP-dependent NAD(P)H-hydrate dehydratase / NAD(P)H-hydrate epimerase